MQEDAKLQGLPAPQMQKKVEQQPQPQPLVLDAETPRKQAKPLGKPPAEPPGELFNWQKPPLGGEGPQGQGLAVEKLKHEKQEVQEPQASAASASATLQDEDRPPPPVVPAKSEQYKQHGKQAAHADTLQQDLPESAQQPGESSDSPKQVHSLGFVKQERDSLNGNDDRKYRRPQVQSEPQKVPSRPPQLPPQQLSPPPPPPASFQSLPSQAQEPPHSAVTNKEAKGQPAGGQEGREVVGLEESASKHGDEKIVRPTTESDERHLHKPIVQPQDARKPQTPALGVENPRQDATAAGSECAPLAESSRIVTVFRIGADDYYAHDSSHTGGIG